MSPAPRPRKIRVDQLLVDRGLAPTRQKAQALILAGDVWSLILPSLGAMLLLGAILFAIIIRKTKKSLER